MNFALIGYGKMGHRWSGVISKYAILWDVVDPKVKDSVTFKSVLKDKKIDAVLIATPHNTHSQITRDALVAGKHVFCEKPGSITAKELKENIKLAKSKNLVYKVGYNYRFHAGFRRAKARFDNREIGELLFIRARHGFGGRKGYEKEWRINKEIGGGGHLHDQGVHLINMALSFMGKVDKVQGLRADTYWGSGTEDNAFVLLKSGKVIASIHSSLTQWKRMHTFEIYGSRGYMVVEGLGKRYGDGEKLIIGKRTDDFDVVKEQVIECDPIADHSLELELQEFIEAVKEGKQLDNTDAYETLKIVESVYRKDKI